MSIEQFSPERARHLFRWKRNRDHCAGVNAVKDAGTAYLAMEPHMDAKGYESLKRLVEYKPAAARTLNSHVGLVFRKEAGLFAPTILKTLAETIEGNGNSLEALAKWALREFSITNDGGILVDHPPVDKQMTEAERGESDLRPFLSRYSAETIRTIEHRKVGGVKRLFRVVLMDDADTARELQLVDGAYQVTLHSKTDNGWKPAQPYVPLIAGKPLDRIPFIHLSDGEAVAPFDDLVSTNETHYAVAAELAIAIKHCARPQRYVTGLKDDAELDYSAGTMWRFESEDVEVHWNEFSGAGVGAIERQSDRLVKSMAEQGLRLMISEQAPAESVETTQRREAAENSILASNARHVSAKVSEALRFLGMFLRTTGPIRYSLNTDFIPATIDPQILQQLIMLNQAGKLSDEQLFNALQRGELIGGEIDYETHQAQLDTQPVI